jgi:hypothetical protein
VIEDGALIFSLECLLKPLQKVQADEGKGAMQEGAMHCHPPLEADRQTPIAHRPRQRALIRPKGTRPAVPPQLRGRLDPPTRDAVLDAAPPAGLSTAPVIVPLVAVQLVRPGRALGLHRVPDDSTLCRFVAQLEPAAIARAETKRRARGMLSYKRLIEHSRIPYRAARGTTGAGVPRGSAGSCLACGIVVLVSLVISRAMNSDADYLRAVR